MSEFAVACFDSAVGDPRSDAMSSFLDDMNKFATDIGTIPCVLISPAPPTQSFARWRLFIFIDLCDKPAYRTLDTWIDWFKLDTRLVLAAGDKQPIALFNDTSVFEASQLMAMELMKRRSLAGVGIPQQWVKDPRAVRFMRLFAPGQGLKPEALKAMADLMLKAAAEIEQGHDNKPEPWQVAKAPKTKIHLSTDDIAPSGDKRDPRELGY